MGRAADSSSPPDLGGDSWRASSMGLNHMMEAIAGRQVLSSEAENRFVELFTLRSAHLTRVFSEFPSSHQYDCVDGMRQRNDVCRNAKRGALNPRHARLPNLTLQDRAGSAGVDLTTMLRLVPSHPSPRVKSHHGVLSLRPKNFQNSSTRRPRRKCPRAQTAESGPATNSRSCRGDPLILPGKSHCFEPRSRLFPPFFAL